MGLAEGGAHERHPRRVVEKEGEGGGRELGQLQVVTAGVTHLDLHEAALLQVLLHVDG